MESSNYLLYSSTPKQKEKIPENPIKPLVTLNGTLFIKKTCPKTAFGENIRIGVSIRAPGPPRSNDEWTRAINQINVIKDAKRGFQQTQKTWFENGTTWIIATPVFGTTSFKIIIEPSALLTTGLVVETYLRKVTAVHNVQPQTEYGAGVEINFKVNWEIGPDHLNEPSSWPPTVKASSWTPTITKRKFKELQPPNRSYDSEPQPGTSRD